MSIESASRYGAPETPLTDAVIGGYVSWREKSAAVAATYETWARARGDGRATAFADYVAALDREEHAACEYQRFLSRQRSRSERFDPSGLGS